MKRFVLLMTAIFLLASNIKAQDHYFYSDQRQISIEEAEKWKVIQIHKQAKTNLIELLAGQSAFHLRRALDTERGFYWLEASGQQVRDADLSLLAQQVPILRSIPAFFRIRQGDTTYFVMTDEFNVKFKSGVTRSEIEVLNDKHGVVIAPFESEIDERQANEYGIYLLRVTQSSGLNALEVANLYYESPLTVWSVPNFYMNYRLDSERLGKSIIGDPLFSDQWYLKNTGQGGGVAGIDIEADPAWDVTTGSSSITVAVIDDGVEMHEDFYSGQLVSGYTPGGGSGAPAPNSQHGQAVAGIIAANHNTTGVRGIAPKVKIMPVKIFNPSVSYDQIADAIDYAWQNGADVLSNSWSIYAGENFYHDGIAAAITRAREDGRGGLGTVVVKSAGNNASYLPFPGTVPGVLTVGAVTNTNEAGYYTIRDPGVDIVAPSSGGTLDVTTMDRMGSTGYSSGDYTYSFGGTSAAAPQASGVAALLLSDDPTLTEQEVRTTLKTSADDYGSTDWDGNGRLNAHEALPAPFSVFIDGPTCVISNRNATWTAQAFNEDPPVQWHWYRSCKQAYAQGSASTFGPTCENGWKDAGYGDTYTTFIPIGEPDFSLKLEGTDDSNEFSSVIKYVTVEGANGCKGGPSSVQATPDVKEPAISFAKGASAILASPPPKDFTLTQNNPNPFSSQTTISYGLPEAADVRLIVYDILGRQVSELVSERQPAGWHEAIFHAEDLTAGIYFVRMRAGEFIATQRMTVVH